MQNTITGLSSKKELRAARISSLRLQIKQNPLISQKSIQLQTKFQGKRQKSENTNKMVNDDCSSVQTLNYQENVQGLSSFVEKYEVLEKLGEGGNACVYKCRHRKNEKFYAVKKFKHEEEHILELKKNFIYLKELHHSSIIEYRALYFDPKQRCTYLVMEYFNHPSLAEVTISDEEELITIVKEILNALKYIHDRNICHRDIKPENILYSENDRQIKVIDFGISKRTYQRGGRRDMLTIIGTHFYLAPEVYIGGGYDQKIDLWALGVTIYKLITGVTPFESEYHSDTIANILRGTAQFQNKIWRNYSLFSKDFVVRLLKSKNDRMNLSRASKHLWLHRSRKLPKLTRYASFTMELSDDFHNQMNNQTRFAKSKQQGFENNEEHLPFYKSLNDINQQQYDLDDSDDQNAIVSPFYKGNDQHRTFESFSQFTNDDDKFIAI